jgi:predicted dehydrogenase
MSSKKVRLGIVGVGSMGVGHARTCKEIEEFELAAVADVNAERARQVGEQFGVPYFSDHRKLVRSGLVDAVVIATVHYFHPPVAVDAFKAGVHVLSEKPLAVQISKAEQMARAAKKHGKVFSVMFQMRTTPVVKKAKELIETGQVGDIRRTLLISPEFRSQAYYNAGAWRATWGGEGGGVLLNQAPHIMDVFTMLAGMPSRVHGRCETLMHDIEVEDQASAMLEYANGAVGYFYVSTCEVGERVLEIVGDKGRLRLEGEKLTFQRFEPPVSEFNRTNTAMWGRPDVEAVDLALEQCESGHQVVLRNFARAILHGEPLVSPGEVGLSSLELANAITLSSFKREPVKIPIKRREFDQLIERLRGRSRFKDQWGETKPETDPAFRK